MTIQDHAGSCTNAHAGESGKISVVKTCAVSPSLLSARTGSECTTNPGELNASEESDLPAHPGSGVCSSSALWRQFCLVWLLSNNPGSLGLRAG